MARLNELLVLALKSRDVVRNHSPFGGPPDFLRWSKTGVTAGNTVILPIFCSGPLSGTPTITFKNSPGYGGNTFLIWNGDALGQVATNGTSQTATIGLPTTPSGMNSPTYSLSAVYIPPTGAQGLQQIPEYGALFDVPTTSTASTIVMIPTTGVQVSVSVTDPLTGPHDLGMSLTHAQQPFGIGDYQEEQDSFSGTLYGTEAADGIDAYASVVNSSGNSYTFTAIRVLQPFAAAVTIDTSTLLPRVASTSVAFSTSNGTISWTIGSPGPATVGVVGFFYEDQLGIPHYDSYFFDPPSCTEGTCVLVPPPQPPEFEADAVPTSGLDVSICYFWRPSLAGYQDFSELFLVPYQFAPGMTEESRTGSFSTGTWCGSP